MSVASEYALGLADVAKARSKIVDAFLERSDDAAVPRTRLLNRILPAAAAFCKPLGRYVSTATAAAVAAAAAAGAPAAAGAADGGAAQATVAVAVPSEADEAASKLAALAESMPSAALRRHVAGAHSPAITTFAVPMDASAAAAPAAPKKRESAPCASKAPAAVLKRKTAPVSAAGQPSKKPMSAMEAMMGARKSGSAPSAGAASRSSAGAAPKRKLVPVAKVPLKAAAAAARDGDALPSACITDAQLTAPPVKRRIAPVQAAGAPAPDSAAPEAACGSLQMLPASADVADGSAMQCTREEVCGMNKASHGDDMDVS